MLWSRVTNPKLSKAVGIPPADLPDEVAAAWFAAGHDVDACFDAAAAVSGQWLYRHAPAGTDPCRNVRSRLTQVREEQARVKLQLFTVREILNPQPDAAAVVHALLAWIDEADKASQRSESKPPFCRPDGAPIFPPDDTWWLTSFEKRCTQEPGADLAGDDVPDEDLTLDPADAGVASSDTSSSETSRDDEDQAGQQNRSAVAQSVKAAVASLFASTRRPKPTESLRIRQNSDSAPDDEQQLRDDDDQA